jgi:tetratricopeptide (TPR) repeat protein
MLSQQAKNLVQSALDIFLTDKLGAAQFLRQAYDLDAQEGMSPDGIKVGAIGAHLFSGVGRTAQALSLLLDLKLRVPAMGDDLGPVHMVSIHWADFWLRFDWLIAPEGMDQILEAMVEAALPDFSSGLAAACFARGHLHRARGRFEEALTQFERAWTHHSCGNIFHGHRHRLAFAAAECCLRLGRLDQADRWMDEPDNCDDQEEAACTTRMKEKEEFAVLRAVVAGDLPTARIHARTALASGDSTFMNLLYARLHMADSDGGDPACPDHPARALLARQIRPENQHERFLRRLAILDLRIQALRHAGGLSPAMILWHVPAMLLPPAAPEDDRRRRYVRALNAADRAAVRLDKALAGDGFRSQVMQRRTAVVMEPDGHARH